MAEDDKSKSSSRTCDNHPDVEATLVTDGDGKFSEIALCEACIPDSLKR